VEGAILAKMRNNGEACTAANRIYVQKSVAEEFSKKLAEKIGAMKVGDGLVEGTQVGPLVDQDQLDKVAELVDQAVSAGATVLTGGKKLEGDGYFFAPTVLTDVPEDATLRVEEIFGPVAPIVTFETDDEAIELANSTEYGLAAYLFCRDLQRSMR